MKTFFKKYKILLIGLLLVFALVGGTLAYMSATDTSITNIFSFAKVDTGIEEDTGDDTPDQTANKVVTIQNNEVSPVYVRSRVLASGADADVVNIEYVPAVPSSPEANTIYIVYNNVNWVQNGEWFYYQGILPGKAEDGATHQTEALITSVVVGDEVDKTLNFEVDIYEESVLTGNTIFSQEEAIAAFNK